MTDQISQDELRNQPASLALSHGWKWELTRKSADAGVFRIVQTNSDDRNAPAASIEVRVVDLPWIWIWLMGSYSAEEWPSTRNFPGGTVLFMEPNPKPEVWLVQFPDSDDGTWYGHGESSRPAEPVGRLVLFEEDLQPIVAWLEELSTRFGIERRAALDARVARVGPTRGTGTDERFYKPQPPAPPVENPASVPSVEEESVTAAPESPPSRPVNEAEEVLLLGYTGPGGKEIMQLWPRLLAMLQYYFPRNPVARVGRLLRLVPQVNHARFDVAINKLLRDATRTRDANAAKWTWLLVTPAPAWLMELRRLAYQLFEDELQAIVTLGEAVDAARAGNNALRRQSLSRVRKLVKRCRANRERLTHLAMGSWYKDPTDD